MVGLGETINHGMGDRYKNIVTNGMGQFCFTFVVTIIHF